MRTIAICLSVAFAWCLPAVGGARTPAEVRDALRWVYIHGVTEEIAHERVGSQWEPLLRELLFEESFPRRDNVVYFLGFLGGPEAVDALLAMLESPPAGWDAPQEDRALLYAPRAIGRIAARGHTRALDALLSMTADRSDGGPLFWASLEGDDPPSLLADLVEGALYGLVHARDPSARSRLEAVRDGRVALPGESRDFPAVARQALLLLDELTANDACRAPGAKCSSTAGGGPGFGVSPDEVSTGAKPDLGSGSTSTVLEFDTQDRVHDAPLTYANHVDHPDPMTDDRLDLVFANSNLRAGRSDYGGDVACCITVSRSGTGLQFGTPGDGLDIVDNPTERDTVLTDPTARVKVVRAINYCSGGGAGIIGCAIWGGRGMMLIRLGLADEGVTWIHEYGHNAGLGHSGDFYAIMFGGLHWANNGLSVGECNTFHSPTPGSGMNVVDTGACSDADADEVQDGIDNCPGQLNWGQENADGDAAGDACDCAPNDASVTDVAGPASDLSWESETLLSWQSSVEAEVSNLYRGTFDTSFHEDWTCLADDVPDESSEDSDVPPGGTGFHYLVTGENSCGESDAGQDSSGTDRSLTPCP